MTNYGRYGSAKYGQFVYGQGDILTLGWVIDIDWDEDGSYDLVNESPFCIEYTLQRGRQYYLATEGGGFEVFQPGRLTLTLLNTDGRYDPFNTDGPYYPNVDVGKFIKVQVAYDGVTYDRFAGIIEDIQPARSGGFEVVQITALDGWDWLQRHFTAAPVEASKESEDALTDILTDADWPAIWGSSIGAGAETLAYWWEDYRSAAEAIKDLVDAENGRFWIGADGSANFESRQGTGTRVIDLEESELLKDISVAMPWEAERNIAKVVGHPIKNNGTQVIWTLQDIPQVAAGEYLELIVDFTYGGGPCAAVEPLVNPVENTDYDMNAQADGGGADHSGNFTVSIEATWGMRAKLKYLNNGGSASYITLAQLRGTALTWPDAVESESDERAGSEQPRYFVIDSKHIQSSTNVPVLADYFGGFITMTKLFPTVQIENRPVEQFTPDLLNRMGLDIPTKGVEDKSYRLGYIDERWLNPTGQAVQTLFMFEPCEELGTYWIFPASMGVTTIFIY